VLVLQSVKHDEKSFLRYVEFQHYEPSKKINNYLFFFLKKSLTISRSSTSGTISHGSTAIAAYIV